MSFTTEELCLLTGDLAALKMALSAMPISRDMTQILFVEAIKRSRLNVAHYLLKVCPRINFMTPATTQSLFIHAIRNSQLDAAQYLLHVCPQLSPSADVIRYTIFSGSAPLVSHLLAKHPFVLQTELDMKCTPLAFAIMCKQDPIFLSFLLARGADPNKPSDPFPTPLALAAKEYDTTDAVDILLQYGAMLTGSGMLETATLKGKTEIIRHLLRQWSTPETIKHEAVGALHIAIKLRNLEITEMLVQQGVNVLEVDFEGKTAIEVARAMRNLGPRSRQLNDMLGKMALRVASVTGDEDLVHRLLQALSMRLAGHIL